MIPLIIISSTSNKAILPLIPVLLKGILFGGKKHGIKKVVVDTAKDVAKDKVKEEIQKKDDKTENKDS